MSTFGGKILEIQNISVDCFDGSNHNSHAYFLSHCHEDHMHGLKWNSFQNMLLAEDGVYLYGSHITTEILRRMFPKIAPKLKELSLGHTNLVPVKDKFVSVTLIPAGHCPGSVMFLFEYKNKTVLYTGDYRLNLNDYKKIKAFYNSAGQLKHIDKLYLDTTFFKTEYSRFPQRGSFMNKLCEIMQNWIAKSKNNVINLQTPAKYGKEYLIMEISKAMKMPIHVEHDLYDFYNCIPEMNGTITNNGNDTKIHNACGINYTCICKETPQGRNAHVKVVRASAMLWNERKLEKGDLLEECYGTVRLCYSSHASLEEGQALIRFLKPDAVEACVLPEEQEATEKMLKLIEETMQEYQSKPEAVLKQVTLFKVKPLKSCDKENVGQQSSVSEEVSDLLDSPPTKRKK